LGGTTMRWIRANLRFGAWCALFALAVQFALSFGHVHFPGRVGGTPALLALLVAPSPAIAPDAAAKPAKPAKSQIAHDQCAICASIQLAGSLLPAAAPILSLPANPGRPWLGFDIARVLAASPHHSFQARAPPTV
jgi:hypothetical protein